MRRLIADVFKLLYELTGYKFPSFIIALIYISALNLITINGLAVLLAGAFPELGIVLRFFMSPFLYGTIAVVLAINYIIMLPLEKLSQEKGTRIMYLPLILYTLMSLLLFAYTIYNRYDPLIL